MSTTPSMLVSPGAEKAKVSEPSPWSSQPTARGMPRATSAAATLDMIPLVPVHEPSPRPIRISATSSAADSPLVTVIAPVVRSTRPPAERSSPATVVAVPAATRAVAPADTLSTEVATATGAAISSVPAATEVVPA